MSDCYWMWRGQLCVGSKNIGPTTIWSDRNTLIPDIGVDLKMTSFAEYTVLWEIIGTRHIDLSGGSVSTNGKDVSVFSLEGHSSHFEQLSQELTQTSKPQVLIGELYNPGIRFVVVIFPNCAEVEKLGLKKNSGKIVSSMNVIFISCSSAQKQEEIYRNERSVQLPKMEKAMSCHESKESNSTRIGAEYGKVMQNKEQNVKENDGNNSSYCENKDDVQKPPSEVILREPQDLKKTSKMDLKNGGGMEEKSVKAEHEKSEKGGKVKDRNENSEDTCHKRSRERSFRSREKSKERVDKANYEKSDKGSLSEDRNKNDSDYYHNGHTSKMNSKFLETLVMRDGENDDGKYHKDRAQVAESPKKKSETPVNRSKHRNKKDSEQVEEHIQKLDRDEKHRSKREDREKASYHSSVADSPNIGEVKVNKSTDKFHRGHSGKEKEERNFHKKDKKDYVPDGGTNSICAKHSDKNKNEVKGKETKMENKKNSSPLKESGDIVNHRGLSNSQDRQEQEHTSNKWEKTTVVQKSALSRTLSNFSLAGIKTHKLFKKNFSKSSLCINSPDHTSVSEKMKKPDLLKSCFKDDSRCLSLPDVLSVSKAANEFGKEKEKHCIKKTLKSSISDILRKLESPKKKNKKRKNGNERKRKCDGVSADSILKETKQSPKKHKKYDKNECFLLPKTKCNEGNSEKVSGRNLDIAKRCFTEGDESKTPTMCSEDLKIDGQVSERGKDINESKDTVDIPDTSSDDNRVFNVKVKSPSKMLALSICEQFNENAKKMRDCKVRLDDILERPEYVYLKYNPPHNNFHSQLDTMLYNEECLMCQRHCLCKFSAVSHGVPHKLDVETLVDDRGQENIQFPVNIEELTKARVDMYLDTMADTAEPGALSAYDEVGDPLQDQPLDLSVQCNVTGRPGVGLQRESCNRNDMPKDIDVLSLNQKFEKQFLLERFLATMNSDNIILQESCLNLPEKKEEDLSYEGENSVLHDVHIPEGQHPYNDGVIKESLVPDVESQDVSDLPVLQDNLISSSERLGHTPKVYGTEIGINDNFLSDMPPNTLDLKTSTNSISSSDHVVESLPEQSKPTPTSPGEGIYSHLFPENSGNAYDPDTSAYNNDEDINKVESFQEQNEPETTQSSPSSRYNSRNDVKGEANQLDTAATYHEEGNCICVKCDVTTGPLPSCSESGTQVTPENPERISKFLYTPTAFGIENLCNVIKNSVSTNFTLKERFTGVEEDSDKSDKYIQNVNALLIKKIQMLQPDGNRSDVEKGTNRFCVIPDVAVSENIQGAGTDDDFSPVDTSSVFTPDVDYQPNWEERILFYFCHDKTKSVVQKFHLINASENDIAKLKLLATRYKLVNTTMSGVMNSSGNVYVRPEHMEDLLENDQLQAVCSCPDIKFGVCLSLNDILKVVGRQILKSKFLLLIHHTSFLDVSLAKLITTVVRDFERDQEHHHQIFITSYTLKVCYWSLVSSQKAEGKERAAYDIVVKNMCSLLKCISAGAGKIVDGGLWKKLGPDSSICEFITCLRVTHKNLNYIHRHAAVVVGEKNASLRSSSSLFYEIATARGVLLKV
ncbi:uncharacterized protein LOC135210765 [Macrobrachium nipponense]|uniref:uncharacterized protein LOC135210765 n=1 Tax=Macrobrachium nipponense TaxID=159736 RepID=UPI0030C8A024